MKHLAAYLLLQLINPHPTKDDVTSLLATVGIEPSKERLDALFSMLEGKDINQLLEEGKKKLAAGSAAGAGGAGGAVAQVTPSDNSATETREEERTEETADGSDSDDPGFGGLFD